MKIPSIGEVVELQINGTWQEDWLTQKRFDYMIAKEHHVESGVLYWGGIKQRYRDTDKWRIKGY